MIRFALLPVLMAKPVLAHGIHAPVPSVWHGAAHLAVSAGLAALVAVAAFVVIRDRLRRPGSGSAAQRGGR